MVYVNQGCSQSPFQPLQQKEKAIFEYLAPSRRVSGAAEVEAAHQIIDRLASKLEGNRRTMSNTFDGISLNSSS